MPSDLLTKYSKFIIALSFFAAIIETVFTGFMLFKITHPVQYSFSLKNEIINRKTSLDYNDSTKAATLAANLQTGEILGIQSEQKTSFGGTTKRGGVYLGFAFETRSQNRIIEVEQQIGRKFEILMSFTQWGNFANSSLDNNYFAFFNKTGKTPIISWEPWDPAKGVNQPDFRLANIASGKFDSYITTNAQAIKAYGKPVFLRFAHEMNGDWYPWGGTVNGNNVADYIAAYRHVHDLFASNGVNNVTWIWCPVTWSVPHLNGNGLIDYYPGSTYVDWIGLDGYNFGNTKTGQSWQSFSEIFSPGYRDVLSLNKPIMIAETASTEFGGSKSSWIEESFAVAIPNKFPKIKALIWFDINKETNWDINSSPSSISQFKNQVNQEIYKPSLHFSGSKILPPQ